MVMRLASALVLAAGILQGCDCEDQGARQNERFADIVFRGTISEFHDSAEGKRIVVFQVSRVWKGPVSKTF